MRQLSRQRPDVQWHWLYRPHRFLRAFQNPVPRNVSRGLLLERSPLRFGHLFHGLNQRLPATRFPRQIATFHDLFVMTAPYSSADFRARFTEQARRAAAEADLIIAVSAFTARQVTELLGVERARVRVIPHGVRRLALPDIAREKLILHVGAIQRRKNLARLVRAFAAAPADWRLVLAGSEGYDAAETLEEIARSPARARIEITGYIDDATLAELYARTSIFAFPSLDEGFGMPVLEAMAAGIPVIASETSAVGEVAGSAAMLIDPRSEEQLAHSLRALASAAPEIRHGMTERGRLHAAQFTWEKCARETLAVYEELA